MRTIAFILQIICIVFAGAGLTIEFLMEAGLGFILITTASVIFAVSTKLYKLALIKENKELKKQRGYDPLQNGGTK